jgi:hypothetical protein
MIMPHTWNQEIKTLEARAHVDRIWGTPARARMVRIVLTSELIDRFVRTPQGAKKHIGLRLADLNAKNQKPDPPAVPKHVSSTVPV